VGLVSSRKRCPGGMRPQHSAQCSTVTHKSGTLWLRSMVNSARNRRRLASPWVGEEGGGGRALLTGEPDGGAGAGGRGRGVVLGGAGEGAAQLVPAVSPSSRTHMGIWSRRRGHQRSLRERHRRSLVNSVGSGDRQNVADLLKVNRTTLYRALAARAALQCMVTSARKT
jgi:hypothetical protein